MNASTIDRLSKIMEDLSGVVDEMTSGSKANGAFALACAKMEAWRQVEGALRERASQVMRERNALLPVHQLPVEVLAGIFETVVAKEFDAYYPRLKRLRTVSRLFLGMLDPHLNRLKSIEITYLGYQLSDSWYTASKLLTTPQPSLERFSLRNESHQTNLSELTFFADQAPRLRNFQLRGMCINCQGAIFGGLNDLSLSEVTVPSLKDLLSVITRCGHLVDLWLKDIWFQTADSVDSPWERVSLPFLRRFSLRQMSLTLKERLLRDFYAPQCAYLGIFLQADAENPQDLVTRCVPKWFSQRRPPLPEITRIVFELSERAVHLYLYDSKDSECFRLFLCHDKSASISLAILTVANKVLKASAPKADTHLAFGEAALVLAEEENYRDQLRFLPRLTKMDIGAVWSSFYLGYWESEGAKNFKLPAFPGLQELCFHQQPLIGVIKVVRMLLDASEARREGVGFKVSICVWEDSQLAEMESTVEEVKGIVGEDRVIIRVNQELKRHEWSL